jgi:cyclopropane-fatty-acyl-phospholipid synthase
MNRQEKQLNSLRTWLHEVLVPQINADLTLRLWNGELISLSENARQDIIVCINSPDAIRRLIFAPKLMTMFELYAESLLDIEGGTPLEAARRWDHIAIINFARKLNKLTLLKALFPFLWKAQQGSNTSTSRTTPPKETTSYNHSVESSFNKGRKDLDMIQFHYDVSNDFYRLFLDPEMVYSCGYFSSPELSLEQAQVDKLDMICKRLRLKEGERLLDIGCGWGGLVCYAAQHYGVKAYGVTLSRAQFDFVQAKIKRLGLQDKVTIELKDYREIDTPGEFDKIAQIEMFEHLGLDNHDRHFKHIHQLLRARGLYLHQASTRMATPDISQFRKKTPYQEIITKFIFPGGEFDYIGLSVTNLERHRFEVHDVEAWREHFQITLEHWTKRLWDNREKAVAEIGWPKVRLWLLYFSLFAVAFERNTVGVYQTLASKRRTGPSHLPLSRDDLYK